MRKLLIRLLLFLLEGRISDMAVVYATLIVAGRKTFAQVPALIKDDVKDCLVALDCAALAE